MARLNSLLAGLLLMMAGFSAAQQPPSEVAGKHGTSEPALGKEVEWLSYRDAYRSMLRFEKYGKAKSFLQNHFQISPKDKTVATDALRLDLISKSSRLHLSLDATGRTALPLLKTAYDENAELLLNQKVNQFQFRPRVSILIRTDGVYESTDLREACEQALAYQHFLDAALLRGKKCLGVRFVYPKKNQDAIVEIRHGARIFTVLPMLDGAAFWDETNERFKTATYLFSNIQDKTQLVTRSAPIAIAALFD